MSISEACAEILCLDCQSISNYVSTGGQNIISIPATYTVEKAYQILSENEISSAPVVDEATGAICGMLDYGDLASIFLDGNIDYSLSKSARLIVDSSLKDPFYSTGLTSPISTVVEVFGNGIHRIILMNDSLNMNKILRPCERISGILSQSDILRWLAKKKLPLSEPLSSIVKITRPAVSINAHELLIKAIKKMKQFSISSIAIVDHLDVLTGNLSVSDLRFLINSKEHHSLLYQPIITFVSMFLSEEGLKHGKDRYPFYDVAEDTPLRIVIEKLLATKTHRVWVIDDPEKHCPELVGVVSMTDIIRGIFNVGNKV